MLHNSVILANYIKGAFFMNDIYSRIDELCKQNKTNVTAMCRELKIQRSSLSELKAGRAKSISADKIAKIADYFNVPALYITDGIMQPQKEIEKDINPEEIAKVALFGGDTEVTPEMWQEVKQFVGFIKQKHFKD